MEAAGRQAGSTALGGGWGPRTRASATCCCRRCSSLGRASRLASAARSRASSPAASASSAPTARCSSASSAASRCTSSARRWSAVSCSAARAPASASRGAGTPASSASTRAREASVAAARVAAAAAARAESARASAAAAAGSVARWCCVAASCCSSDCTCAAGSIAAPEHWQFEALRGRAADPPTRPPTQQKQKHNCFFIARANSTSERAPVANGRANHPRHWRLRWHWRCAGAAAAGRARLPRLSGLPLGGARA